MKKVLVPLPDRICFEKTQPGFCRAGPKRGTAGPPGPGLFTSPFLSERYSSDRPPGLGNFAAPGGPTHSS